MKIAIEAKASSNVNADHLKGLRQLAVDHPEVGRRIVVCLEDRARRTPDGIEILPVPDFLRRLWGGELA
jgi:predicted AAA+ superfamily ATPase